MGVRDIVVSKKKQLNTRVYFGLGDHTAVEYCAVVQSRPTTSIPPLLWDGFPQKMPLSFHTGDYRVQAPMTLSMRDIVTKTYASSTFVWKECKFLSF